MAKVRLTKPLIALFAVLLAMPLYAAEKASPPKEPGKISAPASTELGELSEKIKQLVKGLEYSDKVAEDFVKMVSGWKDAKGRPVLISWEQRLNRAKDEYRGGKISKDRLAEVEESIAKELSQRTQKEIAPDYSEKFFDLADVIKHRQAVCLGYSQLFYVLGNALGLSVKAIDVDELVIPGPLPELASHIACLVSLADNETMMVDLAQVTRALVSEPFITEKEFTKVGNFWELQDKANPLKIHRRIEILDENAFIAVIYYNRGNAYAHLGQYTRAISDCTQAIQLNPEFALAYSNRGLAYGRLGQYTRAISDFNQAIQLNPEFAEAYTNRGIAYRKLRQYTQAFSDYNQAIELNPKFAEAYCNRGVTYAFLGKSEEAKKDLLKAVELDPALKTKVKKASDDFKLGLKLDNS
jgi:tetratricopeptide (TPR) repeat protein